MAIVRLWLKEGCDSTSESLKGCNVSSKDGAYFVELLEHELLGAPCPTVNQAIIDRVTVHDEVNSKQLAEGVYRLDDTTLIVRADSTRGDEWRMLNVSAPNFAAAKSIYLSVLNGDLAPEDDWGALQNWTPPRLASVN